MKAIAAVQPVLHVLNTARQCLVYNCIVPPLCLNCATKAAQWIPRVGLWLAWLSMPFEIWNSGNHFYPPLPSFVHWLWMSHLSWWFLCLAFNESCYSGPQYGKSGNLDKIQKKAFFLVTPSLIAKILIFFHFLTPPHNTPRNLHYIDKNISISGSMRLDEMIKYFMDQLKDFPVK